MTILLAVLAGGTLGYVLERGEFCFHSTWRGVVRKPRDLELFRAYLLLLLVAVPVVQLLRAFGVIDPYIPPLALPAALLGGLTFGVGMVIASTCITGLFYKLGHGMIGALVAIGSWGVGDVLAYQGPLSGLRDRLVDTPVTVDGSTATASNIAGPFGVVAVVVAGGFVARYLWRSPRGTRGLLWNWPVVGVATAAVTLVTWLAVAAHGGDFPFGTAGVPTRLWNLVRGRGVGGMWIPVTLISLVPGAYLAARRAGTWWFRGETNARYVQLALGGLVMGVGGAIAGGCNIGHSMLGVPLLSLGSIVTTAAMVGGVFVADRVAALIVRSREPAVPAGR